MAVEEDMPGWTVGATAGASLGFLFDGPSPDDAIYAIAGSIVGGYFEGFFDDEITWGYRRSAIFSCKSVLNKEGVAQFQPTMTEMPLIEDYWDNDWFDFFTKHNVSI